MSIPSGRALAGGVAILRQSLASLLVLGCVAAIVPSAQAAAPQAIAQGVPPTIDQFKPVLEKFGRYIYSERYGNVWQPSSLPPGWHPYPSCHWVYDRTYGWTYDDQTPWGKIVHHYGRWAHDDFAGWVWVPGSEWSPAWVIWRTSPQWTGWAPTPPATDQQETTLAAFNSDKQWTFVETPTVGNRCDAETAQPAATAAAAYQQTKVITNIKIVKNIVVFVLPPPVQVTIIDYDTGPIAPWSSAFIGDWVTLLSAVNASAPIVLGPGGAACAIAPIAPVAPIYKSEPPPPPGPQPRKNRIKQTNITPVIPIDPTPPPILHPRRPPVVVIDPGPPIDVPVRRRPPPIIQIDPGPGGGDLPPRHRPPRIDIRPTFPDGPVVRLPRRPIPLQPGLILRPRTDFTVQKPGPTGPILRRRRPPLLFNGGQDGEPVVR